MRLTFIEHPLYLTAHPNEGEEATPDERCCECAIVQRPDTKAQVLVWRCGGKHWSLSRHDPEFEKHQDLRGLSLTVVGLH